jgi:hypothetical protein
MDATEAIIDRIRSMPNPPCHVGEVVPQGLARFPYVWIMKSGEEYSDDLCYPRHKDTVTYDIEIISDDIDQVRDLTSEIKDWLMNTSLHSLQFVNDAGNKQTIHGITVESHDDSYIAKVPDSDEKIFIAAIDVEAIL